MCVITKDADVFEMLTPFFYKNILPALIVGEYNYNLNLRVTRFLFIRIVHFSLSVGISHISQI